MHVQTGTIKKRKLYDSEQAIAALNAIHRGMSVRTAAKEFGVPRTTLVDLFKGRYSVTAKLGPSTVLTADEENLLCDWLVELCRRGIPVNKNCLLDSVQQIIVADGRKNPFTNNRPGDAWYTAFLQRHPQIAERTAESICRSRGQLTEACIRGWFRNCEQFFTENNMRYVLESAYRQFNGDETGFQLDPKAGQVLAPRGESIYTEAGGRKEQVTVLITSRADGHFMISCIIYPYKRTIPEKIIKNIPVGLCPAKSDSGWMTSDVFYEYMANIFIPELAAIRRIEKGLTNEDDFILDEKDWVIYWMDGYSSHLTLHTSQLCEQNKVMLYCFKAHSSHVCQPNDLGPFKPLKGEWRKAVALWRINHPYAILDRADFASALVLAINELSQSSIESGYRIAGLYPFNEEAVHYDRLTSAGPSRKQYKMSKVGVPEKASSSITTADEKRIALRAIEDALGVDTVKHYCNLLKKTVITPEMMGPLNAFMVWWHFKCFELGEGIESESGTMNFDMGLINHFVKFGDTLNDVMEESQHIETNGRLYVVFSHILTKYLYEAYK